MTPHTCANCGAALPTQAELDGRTTQWRTRVRLYAATRPDEAVGDSDPERAADRPGELVLHGLPAVAEELATVATLYHGETIDGLSRDLLLHKLKSLRPTLARNKGRAAWRVKYATANGKEWIARVDIVREDINPVG